jgi:hypothetical protein
MYSRGEQQCFCARFLYKHSFIFTDTFWIMHKTKILLFSLLLISTQAFAAGGANPFNRSVETTIGTNVSWQYKNDTAVKAGQDSLDSDTYYHLVFDGNSLSLKLSGDKAYTPENARHFEQFAVNDVKIDGKRIPLFQWCLDHQEKQSRFLQQGLAVEKNICENRGENGLFTMTLNRNTLDALKKGKTLSFVIKPFRTTNIVNFSLADFSSMVARVMPEQAQAKAKTSASTATVSVCTVKPPMGFETIKPVQYPCNSVVDESHASKTMADQVSQVRKKREAEIEKKRKAELEKKKKEEEAHKQLELKQKQEAAAIAASKLKQQELSQEITSKMLAMCKSAWSRGENRCYCEKYIDQAPANIKAMPSACK